MKSYTAAEVRAAEQPLLAAGVPLMARASAALAVETRALLAERGVATSTVRVLVLAGAGNNGGDALFAAAELARDGAAVTIARAADRVHEEGLAAALGAGASVLDEAAAAEVYEGADDGGTSAATAVGAVARASDVILDGILGTGTSANPALRGRARELVAGILAAVQPQTGDSMPAARPAALPAAWPTALPAVVAVDLPSGIGADDGAVPDETVLPATLTVTFGGCKAGLLKQPGANYAGRIVVADIGLGPELERITGGR